MASHPRNFLRIISWIAFAANTADAFSVNSGAIFRAVQTSRYLCALRLPTSRSVAGFMDTLCKPSSLMCHAPRKYQSSLFLQDPKVGNAESVVAQVELKHALNAEEGSLSERLRKTLKDLQDLYTSIEREVTSAEAVLVEKKKSMRLLEDRIARLSEELEQAIGDEQVAHEGSSSAIIVGGGRIGQFLKLRGEDGDVIVRSTSEYKFQVKERPGKGPSAGPIYLCVGNDALVELVEATPPERRKDLIFMGEGLLHDSIPEAWALPAVTQVQLGFVIAKSGDTPVDAVTAENPQGYTYTSGPWSRDVAKRLKREGLAYRFLSDHAMAQAHLAHLIWVSSVMLVGKLNQAQTVSEVHKKHWPEAEKLMKELSANADTGDFVFGADYAAAVGAMPVVLKELEWRNGYFYRRTKAALAGGQPDPYPTHTAAVRRLKLEPKLARA